jgi:predicted amidophosphoribosyltransferase
VVHLPLLVPIRTVVPTETSRTGHAVRMVNSPWTGSGLVDVLLDLVVPRPCPGCGGPVPWCDGCAATVGPRARQVSLPEVTLDAAGDFALPDARALARYAGPVRAAILAGKERGRSDLPPLLGRAVGTALIRMRRIALLPGEVWIVPAPSRRAAARTRGGDPVTAMARAAARTLAEAGVVGGVAPCLYTQGRARDSVGLDAASRAANLAGRIRFRPSGAPPKGAPVVLLDDVLTTGSTFVAAVRALSGVGIEVVSGLAVATAAPWRAVR